MAQSQSVRDDDETAFPASEATPGQAESRQARQRFLEQSEDCPWLRDYLQLRLEGWDWRKAAYIAWAASPMNGRWPDTQQKLATEILGLRSDRTIRTWRDKDPKIDERVARLQIEPLMQHRRDVIMALIESAQVIGKNGAPDRRTYLTMTGDLKPKGNSEQAQQGSAAQSPYVDLSNEELDKVIHNLRIAAGLEEAEEDADDDQP